MTEVHVLHQSDGSEDSASATSGSEQEFSDDEISSVKTKSEVDHEEEADDDNDVDDSDDNDDDDDDDDDDDEGNILSQLDERLSDSETHTDSKAGLADAMAKILKKQIPAHQQIILAKGTTDKELAKKRQNIDEDSRETQVSQQKKRLWEEMGRTKPNPLEKERERKLQRIAQRGVVQLFNAVRKQQKVLDEKIKEVGSSELKREKVEKSMTKDKFLDILKSADSKPEKIEIKKEEKWSALREDFMMGAKMKDWDKESDEDEAEDT
ncbi:RRP15-like protein [Magallana gigas]|uniref:RRP15-like protein n=1 Tax=Magallana gigas TaxID=29159 RepID=UPI0005C35D3B|eukprot:XP_011453125.1 PREDICTED: RRP15-like protein [Crassostrea gigas]